MVPNFEFLVILMTTSDSHLYFAYSIRIKEHTMLIQASLIIVGEFKEPSSKLGVLIGLIFRIFPTFIMLIVGAFFNL